MATANRASHNPASRSTGKSLPAGLGACRNLPLKLAVVLAGRIGMVLTWPNIQTVRIAIESEAQYSSVSPTEAANVILAAAQQSSHLPQYAPPREWEKREVFRENTIDRFWFEDARWRTKFVYAEFRERSVNTESA